VVSFSTDVPEKHIASTFRVEEASQAINQREPDSKQANYIQEVRIIHNHSCDDLKSYKF
jgi:hypothetical protein